jgi:hypothetical protein
MNTIPVYVRTEYEATGEGVWAGDFEPYQVRTLIAFINDEGYYHEDFDGKAFMTEGQLVSHEGRLIYDVCVVE